ncbi:MAG: O-antigen ligase family protein [Verrucomicrobiae bacterium]|nr:O-antigen ligase family protein [Verrucomicrobiae bacterium]
MNREAADRWCERGILGLVLAILMFGPLATGAVGRWEFLVIQGLTLGVLLLWGVRLWMSRRPQILWPPICWFVVAFTAYAIGRYLTCDIEYIGRKELLRVVVYAILFFAILNNLHRQESTQVISFTMIFLALGLSLYASYQFLSGSDRIWNFAAFYKGRASGTYISPNHLAGFLEMLLPLALAYTLAGRGKPVVKVFLGYAALMMVAGIGVTLSRGGWVSAGVALIVLFGVLVLHRNYRLPALILMVLLIGAGSFLLFKTDQLTARIQAGMEAGKNFEVNTRYELWNAAFRMWREHVWLGVGPGHFDHRFGEFRPEAVQRRPQRVHNEYLNTLVDWGVVGAGIVALALGALFVGLVRTWKHVRKPEREFRSNHSNKFAFVIGAAAGLLALVIHSVVEFNLQIPANAILAVSLMALLSSHLRFATERYWVGLGTPGKLLGTGALLVAFAWLSHQEVRLSREYARLQQAHSVPFLSDAWFAAMESAASIEPSNFETSYAIGEAFRLRSFEGGEDYEELATQAMTWFARGMRTNPFDGYNHLRYGMCLNWLDRSEEAESFFWRAEELDPNGYFTLAHVGWHYLQTGNYAAAKPWFERSLRLQWKDNDMAVKNLEVINARMLEEASKPVTIPKAKLPE